MYKKFCFILITIYLLVSAYGLVQPVVCVSVAATVDTSPMPTPATSRVNKKKSPKIKVVIDPGHDSQRCTRNHPQLGVNEQTLNLRIAKACYKQLNKYDGIKVYMTRKDGGCPNSKGKYKSPDTSRANLDCIAARTGLADRKKADLYVSLHCNATTGRLGASANGAIVFVSQHPKFKKKCTRLGKKVLRQITKAVDIRSLGVQTRSDASKGRYKNGTVKDYYYLISNNIDNNRPGIIIEHAFMDNTHDNRILKKKSALKKLGIADAEAIAKFYRLKLKSE